jgi:hypothetical protein
MNTGRMTAEQNEVDAFALLMCAPDRQRTPGLNVTCLGRCDEAVRRVLRCRHFRHRHPSYSRVSTSGSIILLIVS